MADIQCSSCGTLSATPRAHQLHICRPIEPIRIADPVSGPPTAKQLKAHGISPTEYRMKTRFGGVTQGRVNDRMANIVLCDRCGSIATDRVAGFLEIQVTPQHEPEGFGLCPGCVEALYRLLKDVDTAPKALTAYREPFDPETLAEPVTDPKESTERAILDGD